MDQLANGEARTLNAEKVTHIKGRLLDQAMIRFSCAPFQMWISHKGKNLLPKGANFGSEFFPLWAVPYSMENHFYHIKWPPLNVPIFITHVRNVRNGCDVNACSLPSGRFVNYSDLVRRHMQNGYLATMWHFIRVCTVCSDKNRPSGKEIDFYYNQWFLQYIHWTILTLLFMEKSIGLKKVGAISFH